MIVQTALLIGLVLFSVLAVLLRDLLKAAISLAVASLFLGIIFFRMNAPYAGVFEISVVAGLITVLFMLTIALTGGRRQDVPRKQDRELGLSRLLHGFLVIDALVMKGLMNKIPALASGRESRDSSVRSSGRRATFDLVGQLAVILAGVFAVLALFRKRGQT